MYWEWMFSPSSDCRTDDAPALRTKLLRFLMVGGFAAMLASFAALAQSPAPKNELSNLAYFAPAEKTLLVTGSYRNNQISMVRTGVVGKGSWAIYSGTPGSRVRLTIDDATGLNEILAMDSGELITVNSIKKERVEYRFYAPDRTFVAASVLFQKDGRWLQGLMKTAAFQGYAALIDVSDVTKDVSQQSKLHEVGFANLLIRQWNAINLIPEAHAQDGNLIRGFFSDSATDARNFFSAPGHEMFKGALAGAAAFTVKLVAQVSAGAEIATVGAAVVAATPFIAAVGVGVAVGLQAARVSNWLDTRELRGTSSAQDLFNRLTAPTRYSTRPPPEAPTESSQPGTLNRTSDAFRGNDERPADALKRDDERRAQLDQESFRKELESINECTRKRDFDCSELHIKKAAGLQGGYLDLKLLDGARQSLSNEKARMAAETRPKAVSGKEAAPRNAASNLGESTDHLGTSLNKLEACERAQAKARLDGNLAGDCRCESRGQVFFCRSASTR